MWQSSCSGMAMAPSSFRHSITFGSRGKCGTAATVILQPVVFHGGFKLDVADDLPTQWDPQLAPNASGNTLLEMLQQCPELPDGILAARLSEVRHCLHYDLAVENKTNSDDQSVDPIHRNAKSLRRRLRHLPSLDAKAKKAASTLSPTRLRTQVAP